MTTLDSTQYTISSIREYESVYGQDFVSPGGRHMAVELIRKMDLNPGDRVLDVGSGLGGSAFVMAREFGLLVDGIDLSRNMLQIATEQCTAYGLEGRVTLRHGNCLELDRPGWYDAVYSRDVFLHIEDKIRLFHVLNACLRPGGYLLFTDYCCGDKPWQREFEDYVADRGYILHTLPEYAGIVSASGFEQVVAEDVTPRFIEILESDIGRIADLQLDQTIRTKLEQSWRGKLGRAQTGDHRWGLITAVKVGADFIGE